MPVRTFRLIDQLRAAPFNLPSTLYETAVDREARGESWLVHHVRTGGREVWTLVLAEEGETIQWQGDDCLQGRWVAVRNAVRIEKSRAWGLLGLDVEPVPADPSDDEEQEELPVD